jgi:hypothetical protein
VSNLTSAEGDRREGRKEWDGVETGAEWRRRRRRQGEASKARLGKGNDEVVGLPRKKSATQAGRPPASAVSVVLPRERLPRGPGAASALVWWMRVDWCGPSPSSEHDGYGLVVNEAGVWD